MAADFSTKATDVNTQIDPAARLVEPVSRQGELDALNQIGRGIGVGARTAAQYMQNRTNSNEAKALSGFTVKFQSLVDAADQGVMSPSEARMRQRALLTESITNDPNRQEEYLKLYSKNLGVSGYDKVATPAIQQMEINQKQIETAVSNGFISAADINKPEKVKQGIGALENYQRVVNQLELDSKKISEQKSRLDLSAAQRAALDKQAEDNATNGLHKVAAAGLPYWRTQYENIKTAAAKATTEQERQQIIKNGIIQLEQDYAQRTAALAGDGLAVNQAKIDQVLLPTKNLLDTYKKELSGEYDMESFKRQSENAQAQIELQTLDNISPKGKALIGVSKLFGQAAAAVIGSAASGEVVDIMQKMDAASKGVEGGDSAVTRTINNKPADVLNGGADEEKGTRAYFDTVKKMMKMSADGKIDQDAQSELNGQLKSVFKSVDVYSNATQSAQEFQPVIDFLADPTVGAYLSQGGKVPPEFTGKAQQVIQDGYQTQVVPLLKEELDQTYARSMKEVAPGGQLTVRVGDIVEPTMDGNRFGFKLKEGVEPSREAAAAVKLMNTSAFSKVMNKMIMSNAHMQGNTDYSKSYEQLAPMVMGTGSGEGSDAKDSKGDDLGLDDLEDDAVIQPTSFVPAEGNPDVDAEVLQRFGRRVPVSIRNNNMGAISITGDVASSWAAQQPGFIGTTKRPKNEGGYYAAYATPEDGVAAASKLLVNYGEKGTNTASKIVRKWSTDTAAHNSYANTLVKYLNNAGYDVDGKTQLDLTDPGVRLAILKAKSAHESGAGKQVYSDAVFERGVLGENT